jgi:predicted metalloprotease with PDZ domain
MKYTLSYQQPHQQFLDIKFEIDGVDQNELLIQLPAWRPGRYELGNFAKNVQKWGAYDANGNQLKHEKVKKDLWKVQTNGADKVEIRYNYYASELNAGSTWLDEKQLYVNPVNCFLYVPDRADESCVIELQLPDDYEVASPLEQPAKHQMLAANFQQVADSPFIASNSLQHKTYTCEDILFHVWFQGEIKLDWDKIITDFEKFTKVQIDAYGEFPVKEYHFLNQILPYRTYHGVEHEQCTVISLGPSYHIMGSMYDALLGVSSHELYHTWNIKAIRPAEMYPYDFSKENYSKLGYVAEGVTTYYGDIMLLRGKVFSNQEYFKELEKQLKRHFDNFGRENLSVADSSFDTWLDGYVQGIPNRKVSIYTEGCLIAFMTDVSIQRHTKNKKSLDDVMKILYTDFAKQGKGYTESDYQNAIKTITGSSFDTIFDNFVWGTTSYKELLEKCFDTLGLKMIEEPTASVAESNYGFKFTFENGVATVGSLYPDSVADKAGLAKKDKVLAVNGFGVNNDLDHWLGYFGKESVELTISRENELKTIVLSEQGSYYRNYSIQHLSTVTADQVAAFGKWAGLY